MYACGLRISEAATLEVTAIDGVTVWCGSSRSARSFIFMKVQGRPDRRTRTPPAGRSSDWLIVLRRYLLQRSHPHLGASLGWAPFALRPFRVT
jgi:site-specific recombinase XerD